MKIIAKLILLGLLINSQYTYAQSNADKAKAAYFKADENYQAANYQGCIDKLNEAIQLLGSSNARIQYLMAKSYKELGNYKQVKIELGKYFSYQPKEDDWYKEMLQLSEEADLKIKQNQDAEALKIKQKQEADALSKKDDEAWVIANSLNTKSSLEDYLSKFPSGKKVNEANSRLEKIYWEEAQKVNTIAAYDKFITKFPNSTFKQAAIQKKEPLLLDLKLSQNPNYYYQQELQKEKDGKADPYVLWKLLTYGVSELAPIEQLTHLGGYIRFYYFNPFAIGAKLDNSSDVIKYLTLLLKNVKEERVKANSPFIGYDFRNYIKYCDEYSNNACKYSARGSIMLYVAKFKEDEPALFEIIKIADTLTRQHLTNDKGNLLSQLTQDHGTNKKNGKGLINNAASIEYLLQKGANPQEELKCISKITGNDDGWDSAYNVAKESGKTDLLNLFNKYKK